MDPLIERRRSVRFRRYGEIVGYLFIVVFMVSGFHYIGVKDYQRCKVENASVKAVRDLVAYSTRNVDDPLPAGLDQPVIELIKKGQAQAREMQVWVKTHLVYQQCVKPWPR